MMFGQLKKCLIEKGNNTKDEIESMWDQLC